MSISRREVLVTTCAAFSAAFADIATTTVSASPAASSVHLLLDAHTQALAVSERLWCELGDIEEANEIPVAKVAYGRLMRGKNDDGTDAFEPLYAYGDVDIDTALGKHWKGQLSMCGSSQLARDRVNANYEARTAKLKAELAKKREAQANAEMACGYTAALAAAKAASAVVDERLDAVLEYPLSNIDEVRRVLAHLVPLLDRGVEGVDRETILAVARSLAVSS